MKEKLTILTALLILFVCVLAFSFHSFSARSSFFSPQLQNKLDKLMSDSMRTYKSPGMSLGIWIPGKGIFIRQKGLADIDSRRKINDTDNFRIGSLTKSFTATVVLQLSDEGKLSLDDKLYKFFPGVPNAKKITVRQLLSMTSGLYSYTEIPWLEKKFMDDRFTGFTPEGLVGIGVAHKPHFAPGKGFNYSNTNYILLGMIIEKVTGNTLEREFKARIFNKLNLKNTTFPAGISKLSGHYIRGYMMNNGRYEDWTDQNTSWAWAAGGIVSNLYDLKTFVKAMGDGKLLGKKTQKERMISWVNMKSKQMPTLKYGLGIFTAGGFIGHNGALPGYVDLAVYNPKNGSVIVFMMNSQPEGNATLEIFEKIFKLLYPKSKI